MFYLPVSLTVKVKVKGKSTMPWRRIGEWRYSSIHSLTSALDGGEWSASRPGLFTPRERAPGTHRIGGWVGPRAVLDAVVKRKIPSPGQESKPRIPIIQPVASCYTDWAIAALRVSYKKSKIKLVQLLDYRLKGLGSIPDKANEGISLFAIASRPALGPTHPPIQRVPCIFL
jgi:hypothetical protein